MALCRSAVRSRQAPPSLMGIALGWVEANVSNGRRDVIGTGLRSLVGSNPTVSTIFTRCTEAQAKSAVATAARSECQ